MRLERRLLILAPSHPRNIFLAYSLLFVNEPLVRLVQRLHLVACISGTAVNRSTHEQTPTWESFLKHGTGPGCAVGLDNAKQLCLVLL